MISHPAEVSAENLTSILEKFSSRKVLLLGDVVADHYLVGHTSRISREAPVLILKYQEEFTVPGQVGNTAANIAALGGRPELVSVVGKDARGKDLIATLQRHKVATGNVVVAAGQTTLTKTRLMAGGRHTCRQQVIRIDDDSRLEISAEQRVALVENCRRLAGSMHAIVVSDYGYGVVTDEVWGEIAGIAREYGLPLVLDSRYSLLSRPGATLATPNEEEALACRVESGRDVGGREPVDIFGLGNRIRKQAKLDNLLITRGNEGMVLFEGKRTPVSIPIFGADECTDVTGAGDTVVATASLALASGASALSAAWLANIAGGLVVMKMGTATVSLEEMQSGIEALFG